MKTRINSRELLNIVSSATYLTFSISLFAILQLTAVILPFLLSVGYFRLISSDPPGGCLVVTAYITAGGGLVWSIVLFIKVLTNIGYALDSPEQEGATNHSKILSLVNQVSGDIGVTPFKAVFVRPDLDTSTQDVGKNRYLNISLIALKYLTTNELKAVIAHECAHHHQGAMLINRVHHRTMMLFYCYASTFQETLQFAEKFNKKSPFVKYGLNTGSSVILLLLPGFLLFSGYLKLMTWLTKDADYEYYCDSVAADYVGGNIMGSALQKIVDLQIAHFTVLKDVTSSQNATYFQGTKYLKDLTNEYARLRYFNLSIRVEVARIKSDTHPPPYLRIQKVEDINQREDTSESLLSDIEFEDWWREFQEAEVLSNVELQVQELLKEETNPDDPDTIKKDGYTFTSCASRSGDAYIRCYECSQYVPKDEMFYNGQLDEYIHKGCPTWVKIQEAKILSRETLQVLQEMLEEEVDPNTIRKDSYTFTSCASRSGDAYIRCYECSQYVPKDEMFYNGQLDEYIHKGCPNCSKTE